MSAIRGARERARAEITEAIKEEAGRQLAEHGSSGLSLRAVSRELGMASSALYRYFPSRDDLLTALIIDAYDAVGEAAEQALAAVDSAARAAGGPESGADPVDRWTAACCAVRDWAIGHPYEYALIYGSPVPGYEAPQATVGPASRVPRTLISVVRDAHLAGRLGEPPGRPLAAPVRADAGRLAAELAPELPIRVIAAMVAAWAQLFGIVSFEVFGQFNQVVEARGEFFEQAAATLATQVGLRPGGPGADPAAEDTGAPSARDAIRTGAARGGVLPA
jgi:AcrR family transcriptional regulator